MLGPPRWPAGFVPPRTRSACAPFAHGAFKPARRPAVMAQVLRVFANRAHPVHGCFNCFQRASTRSPPETPRTPALIAGIPFLRTSAGPPALSALPALPSCCHPRHIVLQGIARAQCISGASAASSRSCCGGPGSARPRRTRDSWPCSQGRPSASLARVEKKKDRGRIGALFSGPATSTQFPAVRAPGPDPAGGVGLGPPSLPSFANRGWRVPEVTTQGDPHGSGLPTAPETLAATIPIRH